MAEDCLLLTSDSEEDEVHLHHLPDGGIRSPDNQNCAQSEQPYGCTVFSGVAERGKPIPANKLWVDSGSASGDASLSPAVVRTIPAIGTSLRGPPAGCRSVFSFEPEDLMTKSLTRLDPRLRSRSGVYREKSAFDAE